MLWVGITGPMGSGKSTVSNELRSMGFPVIDADAVARHVLSPDSVGEAEVFRIFGGGLRDSTGHLDRRALARLVFAQPEKLTVLENLIHPLVREEVGKQRSELKKAGHRVAFYDVPLLYEKKMENQFDHVMVVSAQESERFQRLKARSGLSVEEITERSQHHISPELKEKQASVVILNVGSLSDLKNEIKKSLSVLKISLPTATQS